MDVSDKDLASLARRLGPFIANNLIHLSTIMGDANDLHLGKHVVLMNTFFNLASGRVFVEDYVFFGHNVSVLTGTHDATKIDAERQWAVPKSGRDVRIERGAWICSGVQILGPCTIGRHAVIGAGSLVTGDVRPGWLYAGSLAKPVKVMVPEVAEESVLRDASLGDGTLTYASEDRSS